MKSFAIAKTLNLKRLLLIAVVVLATSLQGCAAGFGAQLHGLSYCNAGDKDIVFLRIQYGEIIYPFDPVIKIRGGLDKNCIDGHGITGYNPIPQSMTVEWKADGYSAKRAIIPIRSLMTNAHPMTNIKIRIEDEKIQIRQIFLSGSQPFRNASTIIFEQ